MSQQEGTRGRIFPTTTRLSYIFVGVQGGLVSRVTQSGSMQEILIQLLDSCERMAFKANAAGHGEI